jgi:hypothetical protein
MNDDWPASRTAGAWKILGAYAVLGPLGAVLSLAVVFSVMALSGVEIGRDDGPTSIGAMIGNTWRRLPEALTVFYVFGGLQTLFIGLVSAWWHRRYERLPLGVPLAAALAAFLVFVTLLEGRSWYGRLFVEQTVTWRDFENPLFFLLLHMALAFWPWLFLRVLPKAGQ